MNEDMNNGRRFDNEEQSTVIPRKKPDYTAGYEAPAKEASFNSADILRSAKAFEVKPEKEESIVLNILKGILGAFIGCIPGFLLWILIGRVGFIASICGMVLALGAVAGCWFFTKDDDLSPVVIGVITVCVIIFTIYLAEKIVWCWELSDAFQKYEADLRQEMYDYGGSVNVSSDEVDKITDTYIKEEFGFTKGTFSDFFSNFSKTLDLLELKKRYVKHMFECYGMAALGGASFVIKMFGADLK
ncbi:MAG: hypothetical protein IJK31_08795 [Ruminococcus sp.]|nr:hypothetical protein [Ruminococcus sp.]HRR75453.1 hypothetical protein [Ruminococcus sp.]